MTKQHPITPPPELVEQWRTAPEYTIGKEMFTMVSMSTRRLQEIATQSAQWGSDQELEACCEWMANRYGEESHAMGLLRSARRPKPQTLNSIALQMLGTIERDAHYLPEITDTIRRALEALDD